MSFREDVRFDRTQKNMLRAWGGGQEEAKNQVWLLASVDPISAPMSWSHLSPIHQQSLGYSFRVLLAPNIQGKLSGTVKKLAGPVFRPQSCPLKFCELEARPWEWCLFQHPTPCCEMGLMIPILRGLPEECETLSTSAWLSGAPAPLGIGCLLMPGMASRC